MKKKDGLEIEGFRCKYPEGETCAGNRPAEGSATGQARLSLLVLFLLAVVMLAPPAVSSAQVAVGISVSFAPPAIPVYVQPPCPGPGYIWTPGYWAWDPDFGYYWVPGTWVLAPFVGALWTPGYWGWSNGLYVWYDGYWGPVVGFYGGINYGFGYTGFGYAGGYWRGDRYYYNKTVNNINVTNITNVYTKNVTNVRPAGASFNGGPGGTTAHPTSAQLAAANQRRAGFTDAQKEQMRFAQAEPKQRATVNRGRPAVAATIKPGVFTGRGVVGASRAGAPYKAPPPGGKAAPGEQVRTPKPGAETHPRATAPGPHRPETAPPPPKARKEETHPRTTAPAPGAPRREPERPVTQPRSVPHRPETAPPPPKVRKEEAHPPVAAPQHVAPGAPRKEPERPAMEPHPAPHRPETAPPPHRPEAAKPPPPQERPKGEKEEPR